MNRRQRFESLWRRMTGADPAQAWAALDGGYGDPARRYHDWAHIEAMLAGLDACKSIAEFDGVDFDRVELAIWFHDAVYDPLAKDNEARSAALFRELAGRDLSDEALDRIDAMIAATANHTPSADAETRLLLDLDLAVLGAPAEAYRRYVDNVRVEYHAVPDKIWTTGRAAVLRSFLDRPAIYQTRHFSERLEQQARANIAAELRQLDAQSSYAQSS